MLDEYDRLMAMSRSMNGVNRVHIAYGNTLTPFEVIELSESLFVKGIHAGPVLGGEQAFSATELRIAARDWIDQLRDDLRPPGKSDPEPFGRRDLRKNATLFTDGRTSQHKTLLLAFPGANHRLMMPISAFLQNLDAAATDLVVIRDGTKTRYLSGIDGLASSIEELADVLPAFLGFHRYERVAALGTSAGALPLLIIALRSGVENIALVGPLSPFDARMARNGAVPIADLLRLAATNGKPKQITVCFGAQSPDDRQAAMDIASCIDATMVEVTYPGQDVRHNALHPLHLKGELTEFLDAHLLAGPMAGPTK